MEELNQGESYNEFENPQPVRPFGLSFFCILSFINAVLQFLINFLSFSVFNTMKTVTSDERFLELYENMGIDEDQLETALAAFFAPGMFYYLITSLLYIGSFIGVLYMWKMQKKGFHYYAIAQILILIVAALMYFGATGTSPWSSIILTAAFIGIYFIYYKKVME